MEAGANIMQNQAWRCSFSPLPLALWLDAHSQPSQRAFYSPPGCTFEVLQEWQQWPHNSWHQQQAHPYLFALPATEHCQRCLASEHADCNHGVVCDLMMRYVSLCFPVESQCKEPGAYKEFTIMTCMMSGLQLNLQAARSPLIATSC